MLEQNNPEEGVGINEATGSLDLGTSVCFLISTLGIIAVIESFELRSHIVG